METNSSPYSISESLKKKKKPGKTYQQQKNANMEKNKNNCKPVKSNYDSPKVTGQ